MAQPQTQRLHSLIAEDVIGRVRMASASFAFYAPDGTMLRGPPGAICFDPARSGGALLNAGTYSMSLIRIATAGRRYAIVTSDLGVIEAGYANHAPHGADHLLRRPKRGAANPVPFEALTMPATDGFLADAESSPA